MTESDWLACADPQRMLEWRQGNNPLMPHCPVPPLSGRKLRLFACALWRSRWPRLAPRVRESVRRVEDGTWDGVHDGSQVTMAAADLPGTLSGVCVGVNSSKANHGECGLLFIDQAALLRDIVGNPWRDPYNPLVTWLTPTVLAVARRVYDGRPGRRCRRCLGIGQIDRNPIGGPEPNPDVRYIDCLACHGTGRIEDGSLDPDTLAVLADALEDAGCDNEEILRHLRGQERCWCLSGIGSQGQIRLNYPCDRCRETGWIPLRGPHVRGCHVLDLLLGKG